MEDGANNPVFRATKRRKVFRKRADSDASGDEPHVESVVQGQDSTAAPADGTKSIVEASGDVSTLPETARVRRPKKHGIAFSSSDATSSRPYNNNEETAMVVSEAQTQDLQNGRFARQTGRTIVADDKHMSAYIDSKLAEMRSKAGAAANDSTTKSATQTPNIQQVDPLEQPTLDPTEESTETAPLSPPPANGNKPTPTTTATTTTNATSKRRQPRRRRQPSPSTLARASLIDQIMRESNHTPHYTPPTNPTTTTTKNPTATSTEEDLDPDAAAAAAFKADFLAQAEARNLSRRKPKTTSTATSGAAAATTSSGPKLGGSRAARVRMRAAEEAKGKK